MKKDQILSVGAIKREGRRDPHQPAPGFPGPADKSRSPSETILIHHIRPVDLENAVPDDEAIRRVLEFVGPRPLIGYFLEFDVGMLDKYARPLIWAPGCPTAGSRSPGSTTTGARRRCPPGGNIDLRFETIRQRLDLPRRAAHDAFNDALLTAMMYLRLKGGWRPAAER